jgi:hypothetical protein
MAFPGVAVVQAAGEIGRAIAQYRSGILGAVKVLGFRENGRFFGPEGRVSRMPGNWFTPACLRIPIDTCAIRPRV